MSKVYVKINSEYSIVAIDGGYTIANIRDPENWVCIDEGEGDRYNLCQSHYLAKPLTDDRGIYQYKLVDGKITERTQAEMDADYLSAAEINAEPDAEADLLEMMVDHEYRLLLLELGIFDL